MEIICPNKTEQVQCNCSKMWPLNNSPEDTACGYRCREKTMDIKSYVNPRLLETKRHTSPRVAEPPT
jgi:hypothetical protein